MSDSTERNDSRDRENGATSYDYADSVARTVRGNGGSEEDAVKERAEALRRLDEAVAANDYYGWVDTR